MKSMKIRKGDTVHVLAGKDRGKQGRVLEARPDEKRVVVENLNMVKRPLEAEADQEPEPDGRRRRSLPGGVIDKAAPIPISNVMLVCPTCNRPTRIGYVLKERKDEDPIKVRVCKRADCRQEIDR